MNDAGIQQFALFQIKQWKLWLFFFFLFFYFFYMLGLADGDSVVKISKRLGASL